MIEQMQLSEAEWYFQAGFLFLLYDFFVFCSQAREPTRGQREKSDKTIF